MGADVQVPQKIPNIILVMELGAYPHRKALHGKQVFGERHHHSQMVEFEKGCELSLRAYKPLDAVIQPVCLDLCSSRDPSRRFTNLGRRTKQRINVLRGGASGVGKAHDGTADEEKLASSPGTAEFLA